MFFIFYAIFYKALKIRCVTVQTGRKRNRHDSAPTSAESPLSLRDESFN